MAPPKPVEPKAGEGDDGVVEADGVALLPKPNPEEGPPNAPKPVAGLRMLPDVLADPNDGAGLAGAGVIAAAPNIPAIPVVFGVSLSAGVVDPPRERPPNPASVPVSVAISESALAMLFDAVTAIGDGRDGLAGAAAVRAFPPRGEDWPNLDGPADANAPNPPGVAGLLAKGDEVLVALPKAEDCPNAGCCPNPGWPNVVLADGCPNAGTVETGSLGSPDIGWSTISEDAGGGGAAASTTGLVSMSESMRSLVVSCTGFAADCMPGYGLPVVLRIFQPVTVPSLAYASIMGGGGSMASSPDGVL